MVSVVIPTYNEANHIAQTIHKIRASGRRDVEIIVVDGGSTDATISVVRNAGVHALISNRKGRAVQMNKGAAVATGEVLYFLHADTVPPAGFVPQILDAHQKGAVGGCFRLSFDYDHWFLKAHAWFSRFNVNAIRFGDQSLFVSKKVFHECGGFREDLLVMEDHEIVQRLSKCGKFEVMNDTIVTSARKFLDNGIFRTMGAFYRIWILYYLGYPQERLVKSYRQWIKNPKL